MSKFEWEKARRWERKPRPLGAMTDKRRRFLVAQQRQLRAEFLKRASETRLDGHVQPEGGTNGAS